jgi:hypothetical protein
MDENVRGEASSTTSRRPGRRWWLLVSLLGVGALVATNVAGAAHPPVGLGRAEPFAVLAGSTITNTGSTTITGNVGLHPGASVTGFGPGADQVTLDGELHVANAVALGAKEDLVTAYNDAATRTPATIVATELGGQILTDGTYTSATGTFGITGTLTLNGGPDDVFIFQTQSTLITAVNSTVMLTGGAQACNVFWQVGSSATVEVGSTFVGTVLALTDISAKTGAIIEGRLLARNGAVTLDTNTITRPACGATTTTSTSVSSTSSSTVASTSSTTPATSTTLPASTTTTPASTTTTLASSTTTAPAAITTTAPAAITTTAPAAITTTTAPASTTTTALPASGTTVPLAATATTRPAGGGSPLARTGSDLTPLVTLALLAIALGSLVRRRADVSPASATPRGVGGVAPPLVPEFHPVSRRPSAHRRRRNSPLDAAATDALSAFEVHDRPDPPGNDA